MIDPTEQKMLHGIEAQCAKLKCILDRPGNVLETECLQQTQDLDELALARLAETRFEMSRSAGAKRRRSGMAGPTFAARRVQAGNRSSNR